jgi:EAL domain-containing protein (putative c-di-GMP-specific phosphodiesterase class I)/CheY-like chemotaxis protein
MTNKTLTNLRRISKEIKVLYVEDDSFQRDKYLQLLNRIFDNVVSAENGEEGLHLAIDNEFDLIISDVEMPGMSGMEMVEKIKQFFPDQAVLFISGHNDASTLQKAITLGIDGYIYKPLDMDQMFTTLETIVTKIRTMKEINNALLTDTITGMYSLSKFKEDILVYPSSSLIIFKIKDFKSFNDYYGYDVGNSLLEQTAQFATLKLSQWTEFENHGLYRVSGTHFVILSQGNASELKPFLKTLIYEYESTEVNIDNTFIYFELEGAVVERNPAFSLSQADSALRQAEKEGRVVVYEANSHLSNENLRKITCKDRIKRAINEERFVPYYQPIVDNKKGMIYKYEALIRLVMPDGEIIPPSAFLPVAKETKMYSLITRAMIEQVLNDFRDSECSVSINLSIDDIKHAPTRQFIYDQIKHFLDPNRIIFELLESEEISFYHEAKLFFEQVQEMGCKVAIDDFGSGFSNFEHLVRLNIDYLKIDGSLIRAIDTNDTSRAIVEMLAGFGRHMGIRTIAEFVSTPEIQNIVTELSVDESQGYHFSMPIPYNEMMKRVTVI